MPRFVVLEHIWAGVHYDVMLEDVALGSLRTWAVEVPLTPGADLPARELATHRLVYLDYEGPISGDRGSVRRLDRGTFIPQIWREDLVEVILSGDVYRGEVAFRSVDPERSETAGSFRWVVRLGKVD
jgi:hypothetical protein